MMIWTERHTDTTTAALPERRAETVAGATGLTAMTRVATTHGWRRATAVQAGDLVLTFDNGMVPVVSVEHVTLDVDATESDPKDWPLFIPAGALGNLSDFVVMPDQALLVESDLAERLFGDRFALIRAVDLDSVAGIFRVAPHDNVDVVTLRFEADQVVFGAGGAMFLCEGAGDLRHGYRMLSAEEAATVVRNDVMPAGAGAVHTAT